jgi:hypothetical protein
MFTNRSQTVYSRLKLFTSLRDSGLAYWIIKECRQFADAHPGQSNWQYPFPWPCRGSDAVTSQVFPRQYEAAAKGRE